VSRPLRVPRPHAFARTRFVGSLVPGDPERSALRAFRPTITVVLERRGGRHRPQGRRHAPSNL